MMPTDQELLERAELAADFIGNHLEHRKLARREGQKQNGALFAAHQRALAAIVSYQMRIQGKKFSKDNSNLSERMALAAQFIQGVAITEAAIAEGLYPQAANLLKQELEAILAIDEIEEGIRKQGKTPRFYGKLGNWKKLYGRLNELAHPSRHEIVENFAYVFEAGRSGPTTIPQFDNATFARLYGIQALMFCIFFSQLENLFVEAFRIGSDDVEYVLIRSAMQLLTDEGVASL